VGLTTIDHGSPQLARRNASVGQQGNAVAENGSKAPKVSIGLPVHNGARYVRETMDSILSQDYADLELIIGDNGSTDATASICREVAARDDRVRYLRSDENLGASWNFNRLVSEARGEYFKWAPHDDIVGPGYLRGCVEVLDQSPAVVLCHALSADIDADGAVTRYWDALPDRGAANAASRLRAVLERPDVCWPVVGLVRRDVLLRTPMIAPYSSSDLGLLAELALHGRFYELPDVLSFHRDHAERSIRAHSQDRDRGGWFAPHLEGVVTFPLWRLGGAVIRAISVAPIDRRGRWEAASVLLSWAWRWRDRLAREAVWGVRELWRRKGSGQAGRHKPPAGS
jgi:glycosyltransferase involved in cell wall biosynthesis